MSALILAVVLLVGFEVIWAQTPVLRPYRWHFRGMLALFWASVLLITAGSVFNLAPGLYFQGIPRFASDAATYQEQAVVLADSLRAGGASQEFFAPEFFNYSRMLALLYVVFGSHAVVGSVFNAVFYMASLVAIFYIGRQLFNDRAGLLAAWLFACSPTFLLHETQTLRWAATTAGLHVSTVGALLLTGPHWVFGFLCSLLGFAVLLNDLPYIARYFMFVVAIYSLVLFLYRSLGRERFVVAMRMAVLAATLMTWYRLSWPAPEGSGHDRRTLEVLIRRDANDNIQGLPTATAGKPPDGGRFQKSSQGLSTLDKLVAPALLARTGFLDETHRLRESGVVVGTAIEGHELATFDEFVFNVPSALRIALIEPTIPRLLSDSNSSSRLRKFAAVEMILYYGITMMALWGIASALSFGLHTPIRSVFILLLVAGVYVLLGTTILNGGTLHRLRHPYVGLLCIFAAAGMRDVVDRIQRRHELAALANATSVH